MPGGQVWPQTKSVRESFRLKDLVTIPHPKLSATYHLHLLTMPSPAVLRKDPPEPPRLRVMVGV